MEDNIINTNTDIFESDENDMIKFKFEGNLKNLKFLCTCVILKYAELKLQKMSEDRYDADPNFCDKQTVEKMIEAANTILSGYCNKVYDIKDNDINNVIRLFKNIYNDIDDTITDRSNNIDMESVTGLYEFDFKIPAYLIKALF